MVFLDTLLENQYIRSVLILLLTIILSETFIYIIKKYIHRLTSKTKTELDDVIISRITYPLHLTIILIGLFFALKSLTIINAYDYLINKIAFVVLTLIISFILSRIVSALVDNWLKVQKRYQKIPQLFNKIITVVIFIISILIIFDHFEIQITPLITALGLGGLAVGLALQSTMSNFFAGLHILSDKPIEVNDYIEIEGNIKGFVDDIGWRSIRLRTLQNTIVVVPNAKLAESIVTNYSMPQKEMSLLVNVGVDYSSDLEKVEKITIEVAKEIQKKVDGAVKDFEPFIRYNNFGDSNINFTVILRVEDFVNKYLVEHEFIKSLKKRYDKEKIEISWPVRKIYNMKS